MESNKDVNGPGCWGFRLAWLGVAGILLLALFLWLHGPFILQVGNSKFFISMGWKFGLALGVPGLGAFLIALRYRRGGADAMRAPADRTTRVFIWMLFIFVISGFSSLVYQVAWQRMMGLFSGSDSIAASLAVGAFLAGLGIGNLISGWFADRLSPRAALLVFAACEIGVAVFGLASKFILYDVLFKRFLSLSGSYASVFLVLFLCLLLPTMLMGISLPVLSRTVVARLEHASRRIGWMYGVNTFGAAVGAFVTGWYLMGTYGCEGTLLWAVAANLTVCALSLALAFTIFRRQPVAAAEPEPAPAVEESAPPPMRRLVGWCLLFGVSGFLSISLEIVWFRYVGVLLHNAPYGFSLVLAVLLLGFAIGSLWGGKFSTRLKDPLAFFIVLQGAVMIVTLAAILALYKLYGLPESFRYISEHTVLCRGVTRTHLAVTLELVLLITFPAALALGFNFPVVQKAVQNDARRIGRRVGVVLLVNVIGNTAGSLVTGLVLLRIFGTVGALILLTALTALLLAYLMARRWKEWRGRRMGACAAMVALLAVMAALLPNTKAFWSRFHLGPVGTDTLVSEDHTGVGVLAGVDGARQTLYVGRQQGYIPFGVRHIYNSLFVLNHPSPEDVLLIGLGTGGQAYSLGAHPATRRVTTVELVQPVYDVLRGFIAQRKVPGLEKLFADPRYVFHTADGRRFLFLAGNKYDVIQTDAFTPVEAHSLMLGSLEFFEHVRDSLKPGGVTFEWAATPRFVNTFLRVFPYVVRVNDLMIGSCQPIAYDHDAFVRKLETPEVRAYFATGDIDYSLVLQMIRTAKVVRYGPDYDRSHMTDINTDLFPKDEYFLNKPVASRPAR